MSSSPPGNPHLIELWDLQGKSSVFVKSMSFGLLQLHRSISGSSLLRAHGPSSRAVEYRNTISWDKFQDGFPNVFIQDVHVMAGKDGNVLQQCDPLEQFLHGYWLVETNFQKHRDPINISALLLKDCDVVFYASGLRS